MGPDKRRGLSHALDEPDAIDRFNIVNHAGTRSEDTPHNLHERKPDPRRKYLNGQIIGYHPDDVSTSEDGVDFVKLYALHIQLFLHPGNIRVVNVAAIKIIAEVHQATIRQNEPVDLQEQRSLQLGGRPLSPDESPNR